MRGIGNYIHYNYINYIKYGTSINDESAKRTPEQALSDQKKVIMSSINEIQRKHNKSILNEIQQNLNFFYSKQNIKLPTGWSQQDLEDIQKQIMNTALSYIDNASINNTTLMVYQSSSGLRRQYGTYNHVSGHLNTDTTSIKAIQSRIDVLSNTLQYYNNKINNLNSNQVQVLQDIENLKKIWFTIQKSLGGKESGMISGQTNFITELNRLWDEFRPAINSQATGIIGEQLGKISYTVAELIKEKHSKQFIEDVLKTLSSNHSDRGFHSRVVGSQRSESALNSKFFDITGGKESTHIQNGKFQDFIGGKYQIRSTQDKVDLLLKLDSIEYKGSIKNISNNKPIGIHSGRSILSLIQEYTDFTNHYLNITSNHPYMGPNNDIIKMNQMLKITVGLKALAGGIYKGTSQNQIADLFIVNQPDGKYYVYSMADLLNRIQTSPGYIQIANFSENKIWDQKFQGSNPSIEGAFSRINKLLTLLHTFDLKITIKQDILKGLQIP